MSAPAPITWNKVTTSILPDLLIVGGSSLRGGDVQTDLHLESD